MRCLRGTLKEFLGFLKCWPEIGQISFFSTILDYNLTKSPTYFIFGEYAVWGVPNFVLVFEKNRTGRFKVKIYIIENLRARRVI